MRLARNFVGVKIVMKSNFEQVQTCHLKGKFTISQKVRKNGAELRKNGRQGRKPDVRDINQTSKTQIGCPVLKVDDSVVKQLSI